MGEKRGWPKEACPQKGCLPILTQINGTLSVLVLVYVHKATHKSYVQVQRVAATSFGRAAWPTHAACGEFLGDGAVAVRSAKPSNVRCPYYTVVRGKGNVVGNRGLLGARAGAMRPVAPCFLRASTAGFPERCLWWRVT
jgi:hypothetical protein